MKSPWLIAPYILQAALTGALALALSTVKPPLKEAIDLGFYCLAYFAGAVLLLLPISIAQMLQSFKAISNRTFRAVFLITCLVNLVVTIWIPRIIWALVGFTE